MPQAVHSSWCARIGVVLCLASLMWLVRPAAQEQDVDPQSQPPVFRADVDAVSVDVTVTDSNGVPITDLTPADFEIREAGELQSMTSFRLVQTGDGLDDARAAREILSFDEHRSEAARLENRLFVIFLDDYHVRRGNSLRVRQQLADFLRQLNRNDLVALATPLGSVSGITFSRSHDALANAVMRFEGRKYDYTPRHPLEYRYQNMPPEQHEQLRNSLTIGALQNLSEYLGTLREGRKSVVLVSEGMSGVLPAGVRTSIGIPTPMGLPGIGTRESSRQESMDFFDNATLLSDIETRVLRTAARNNVSIYTLDPRGLATSEFEVSDDVAMDRDRRLLQDSLSVLHTIAEQTDGRSIVGRNDPLPGLRQMVRDSSAYYLLGYTSTRSPRDGRFQEIRVRVNRRGVQVRARKGYWAYTAEDVARAATPVKESPAAVVEALDALHTSSTAGRGRSVAVWTGVLPGPSEKALVTFAWEAPPASGRPDDAVDRVSIVATTTAGDELFRGPVTRQTATGRGSGIVTFEAPAGQVHVRLMPENASGLRIDADEVSIDVPDFTGAGPRLTTPFLYRGRTARDLQQVRQADAPVPVVTAVFARAERMLIRFGAYGAAGTTPSLTMRLLNQKGDQLAALPAPASSGTTTGLFESEFGFGSFPPGEYVIEIAAEQSGESVKKLVAVRVTG